MALLPRVIADIGGSGSRWQWLDDGARFINGPGYNPTVDEPDVFIASMRELIAVHGLQNVPLELFAYAAGVGGEERFKRTEQALMKVFPHATIQLDTDLMGVAHGLLHERSGLVFILGTGMNMAHYDGRSLRPRMPSLGFILGDEGSGVDIGKQLVRDHFRGLIPQELDLMLFPPGEDHIRKVMHSTYHGPAPNAFLASHAGRLVPHRTHPYVQRLLHWSFARMAQLIIELYPENERSTMVGSGSIAFGYQEELREELAKHGMRDMTILRDPMAGLIERYRQQ